MFGFGIWSEAYTVFQGETLSSVPARENSSATGDGMGDIGKPYNGGERQNTGQNSNAT